MLAVPAHLLNGLLLYCQVGGARYHPSVQEWQRPPVQISDSVDASGRSSAHIGRSRIWNRILDSCFDNSDRREYGRGIAGQIFRRTFKESVRKEKDVGCIGSCYFLFPNEALKQCIFVHHSLFYEIKHHDCRLQL